LRGLTWIILIVMTVITVLSLSNSCVAWDTPDIGVIYDMYDLVDMTEEVTWVEDEYRVFETLNISINDTLRISSPPL
jgi:hypothetical protein